MKKTLLGVIACILMTNYSVVSASSFNTYEISGEPVIGGDISLFVQDAFEAACNGTEIIFPYHANNIYKFYCQEGFLTDVKFEKGETITFVGGGDTSRWKIERATVGSGINIQEHIYIKPNQRGISTNIIVNTSKRTYHLNVISASFYNPSVAWIVEENMEKSAKEQEIDNYMKIDTRKLNFNYTFNKKEESWAPIRVFDDSKKTYLQMKPDMFSTDAPAFFIIDDGKIALANYRILKGYYIVDRVFKEAVLQVGNKKITIKRQR